MHNKKKNEELQSRREFFKRAAKSALPIVAAVALSSVPAIADAVNSNACTCASCVGGCGTACYHGCAVGCSGGCTGCLNR